MVESEPNDEFDEPDPLRRRSSRRLRTDDTSTTDEVIVLEQSDPLPIPQRLDDAVSTTIGVQERVRLGFGGKDHRLLEGKRVGRPVVAIW